LVAVEGKQEAMENWGLVMFPPELLAGTEKYHFLVIALTEALLFYVKLQGKSQ
jgi:hypothetical protein